MLLGRSIYSILSASIVCFCCAHGLAVCGACCRSVLLEYFCCAGDLISMDCGASTCDVLAPVVL